uniref:Uncharacterized protein n=1 Tax=Rhizophora mucronata TaxID=61149 RepID=A0A2P2P9T5_RHIMU
MMQNNYFLVMIEYFFIKWQSSYCFRCP